ncbi:MAG: hypothetical protein V3S87_07440, partial [Alphaproteobacteria bacterium]
MQYPFLEISPPAASALLAALSFVFTLIASLVAGGAVLAVAAGRRSAASVDPRWENLARSAAAGVLYLALIGGGLAGSALWLAFVFVHPSAAGELMRIFRGPALWGWLCLLAGTVSLYLYVSRWDRWRDSRPLHFGCGILASAGLWLSMAIPISAGAFMVTPGFWLNTESARDALFNPSFPAAYLVWSALSLAVSGGAGMVYAVSQKDSFWRETLVQWLGKWTAAAALAAAAACLLWIFVLFFSAVPIEGPGALFFIFSLGLGAYLIPLAVRRPERFGKIHCAAAVFIVLVLALGFQNIRARSQGPYLIQGVLFKNGILLSEIDKLNKMGIWRPAPWRREESPPDELTLGAFSFRAQCYVCHSEWTGERAAPASFRYQGDALRFLDLISARHPHLPIFAGTAREKEAVARSLEARIVESGGALASRPPPPPPAPVKKAPPPAPATIAPAAPPAPPVPAEEPPAASAETQPAGEAQPQESAPPRDGAPPQESAPPSGAPAEQEKALPEKEEASEAGAMKAPVEEAQPQESTPPREAPPREAEKPAS